MPALRQYAGFVPDQLTMATLAPAPQDGLGCGAAWASGVAVLPQASSHRMCSNRAAYGACNFAVPANDYSPLCVSCRQTKGVAGFCPEPASLGRWQQVESAKRQLFYHPGPVGAGARAGQGRSGVLSSPLTGRVAHRCWTGHQGGTITLNGRADCDDERARRVASRWASPTAPSSAICGARSGHFYWDQLVQAVPAWRSSAACLATGADYAAALEAAHYAKGDVGPWAERACQRLCLCPPWEDWAETWAHYLHGGFWRRPPATSWA